MLVYWILLSFVGKGHGSEPCPHLEYRVEDRCCKMCPAGSSVGGDCTATGQTECRPCREGEFSDADSGQLTCRRCRPCHPDHGEVEQTPCTPVAPRTCACAAGFTCSKRSPEVGCLSCSRDPCPAGQGVSKAGNDSWGGRCEPCAQGTFSSSPSQEPCSPWTRCGDRGLQTLRAGSPVSDAVCGGQETPTPLRTTAVALSGAVAGCLLLAAVYVARRRGVLLPRAEKLDSSQNFSAGGAETLAKPGRLLLLTV